MIVKKRHKGDIQARRKKIHAKHALRSELYYREVIGKIRYSAKVSNVPYRPKSVM